MKRNLELFSFVDVVYILEKSVLMLSCCLVVMIGENEVFLEGESMEVTIIKK